MNLDFFKKIEVKKGSKISNQLQSLVEIKYPDYDSLVDDKGNKYLWKVTRAVTEFFIVQEDKPKLLFTVLGTNQLFAVINGKFVIKRDNALELWEKRDKFKFIRSLNLSWVGTPYHIAKNFFIAISLNWKVTIIRLEGDQFLLRKPFNLDVTPYYSQNGMNDMKSILNSQAALLVNSYLAIFEVSDKSNFIFKQGFDTGKQNGSIYSINRNTFIVVYADNFILYRKESGPWFQLQSLSLPQLDRNRNYQLLKLPPERQELLVKVKLLPVDLPTELKILVTEFLW